MALSKHFKLRNGDVISVSALPVKVTIPPISADNGIATAVQITQNGTAVNPGDVLDVYPSDTFTVSYTYQDYPKIQIRGTQIFDAYLDGVKQLVLDDHTLTMEILTDTQSHELLVQGEQPQPYVLTFDNTDSTTIYENGNETTNETIVTTTKDTHISAKANPIPVHFEVSGTARLQVNGVLQSSDDFTVDVSAPTEIDIDASTCNLTIDYGDSSYTIQVPQQVVTICAVHRDWWLFDCWTSPNVGIDNPKSVRTTVDLSGVQTATLVCHYQKFPAIDKPNRWN